MRKIAAIMIALCVCFAFSACGQADVSFSDKETEVVLRPEEIKQDIYLVLVNKENKLPDDWTDRIELKVEYNALGEEVWAEKVTLEHFDALREELLEQRIDIEIDSAYRSVEEQQEIWDEWMAVYGKDYCERYLAKPGYSEHHTGLAIDIFVIQKNNRIVRDNDDMIADIGDFAEIHQLLSKHGFILRYPDGKEDITGYSYEPWHLRYVGEDAARVISECGITLEEYLSSLS